MRDFIERLRAHPEHIRNRMAIATTMGFTGLVAVVWFGTLVTSGSLALDLSTPGSNGNSGNVHTAVAETKSNFQQLLGAVGAIRGASTTPASLKAVDVAPTPTPSTNTYQQGNASNGTDKTVIPF